MQGIRSSRLTIAAWQVMPPESVMIPAARRNVGTQSGEVIGATSTSPVCSCAPSAGDRRMRTLPVATPGDAPSPETSTVPAAAVSAAPSAPARVVIGRVCTIANSPPASAHSMSCGAP
jgi:proteasome lid subunit RPN8/RPN11